MKKIKLLADQLLQQLAQAERIISPVHLRPDGDAIGAALALREYLSRQGKSFELTVSDEVPGIFDFLPAAKSIKKKDISRINLKDFDLIVFLDISMLKDRLTLKPFELLAKTASINIDHHATNTNFADLNIVFPEKSSTCEIIFALLKAGGVKVTPTMAHFLYLGLYTDTGGFEYQITSDTLRAATELIDLGADHNQIVFHFTRRLPLSLLKAWGLVLVRLEVDKKHRFCWSKITRADLRKSGCSPADYKGANEFMKKVEGTDFGLILIEDEPGMVRGNLRARRQREAGGFDVSRLARLFGGGGHQAAAGFRLKGELGEVEEKVLKTIIDHLSESSGKNA